MTDQYEDEPPLPAEFLARLQMEISAPANIESKTVACLRARGMIGQGRGEGRLKWVSMGIAATLIFGTGMTLGTWRAERVQKLTGTPAQRIQVTAAAYIKAMDAASNDDDAAKTMASAAFQSTAYHMFQRFPDDPLGMLFNMTLNRISLIPSGTPGGEAQSKWP